MANSEERPSPPTLSPAPLRGRGKLLMAGKGVVGATRASPATEKPGSCAACLVVEMPD